MWESRARCCLLSREKVVVFYHKFIREENHCHIFFECNIKSFQDVILEGRKIGHEAHRALLLVMLQLANVTFYQASCFRGPINQPAARTKSFIIWLISWGQRWLTNERKKCGTCGNQVTQFCCVWEWFVHSQGTESLNVLIRNDDENDIIRYVLRKWSAKTQLHVYGKF